MKSQSDYKEKTGRGEKKERGKGGKGERGKEQREHISC
jgi:hypothetical protein